MEPTSKVVLPRVTDDVGCSEDPDKEFDNVVFPLLIPLRETVTLFALVLPMFLIEMGTLFIVPGIKVSVERMLASSVTLPGRRN